MNNNNENGVKGLANRYEFKYSDGNMGLYNSWDEMIDFWAPYYDSKADADRHFRKYAYGVAVLKNKANNTEIMAAPVSGPLTASQKKDLITRASEYLINR